MHETHLFKHMLRYFEEEEGKSLRSIKKIYVNLSEFSSFKEGHFLEHCKEAFANTKWHDLEIEVKKVPYGAEFEIAKLDFESVEKNNAL